MPTNRKERNVISRKIHSQVLINMVITTNRGQFLRPNQEIIEHDIKIKPVIIHGKWCEIDTLEDLELAEKIFSN